MKRVINLNRIWQQALDEGRKLEMVICNDGSLYIAIAAKE